MKDIVTKWKLLDVVMSVLIILVLFFAYVFVLPMLPLDANFHLMITVITYLAAIAYLYRKYYNGLFDKSKHAWPIFIAIIVLAVLFIPYFKWLSNNNIPKQFVILSTLDNVNKFIYVFIWCIIIPIEEEILFRGLYYRIIKNRYDIVIATVVSVSLFTLNHAFQGTDLVSIALQGLIYTFVYEKSKSVYSSIIIHVLNNSIWYLVTYFYLY